MVVTVNIPDELAAQAKARGLSLEAYVQEILAQQLAVPAFDARPPLNVSDFSRFIGLTAVHPSVL